MDDRTSNGEDRGAVEVDVSDGIGVIELVRPAKLNAFNDHMIGELDAAVRQLDQRDDVRVVVLHGRGRAFTGGADVQPGATSRLRDSSAPPSAVPVVRVDDLLQGLTNWKPTIAAVHGHVVGLGVGLAFDSEICIADETARFLVAEVVRGLPAARFNALLRYRGVGAFADEVCITGRPFSAEEALRYGLVNEVTGPGAHLERAMEVAAGLAALPPLGIRTVVRMRRYEINQTKQLAALHVEPLQLHLSEDFKESVRALAEKRPPGPFIGR